jgi:nucleoside-diphosphate-sugar epimerase
MNNSIKDELHTTDESINILQLAEIIWKKIKGNHEPFEYVIDESYPYDVQKRIPDTSKAKKLLGFEAKTSIDEILNEVIPWIEKAIKDNLI